MRSSISFTGLHSSTVHSRVEHSDISGNSESNSLALGTAISPKLARSPNDPLPGRTTLKSRGEKTRAFTSFLVLIYIYGCANYVPILRPLLLSQSSATMRTQLRLRSPWDRNPRLRPGATRPRTRRTHSGTRRSRLPRRGW